MKCNNCDSKKNLIWHHIHPDAKVRTTGNAKPNNRLRKLERAKCMRLCKKCHKLLHLDINKDYLTQTQELKQFRKYLKKVLKRIYRR